MHRLLPGLLLLCLIPCTAAAQDAKAALIGLLGAFQKADTEQARDSINPLIKEELRALLQRADGLTLDMDDVPISRVDAPDGSLRLITWNNPRSDGTHRYEGMLLAQLGRKRLLLDLTDATASITNPELAELSAERWYGALYYEIIPVKKGGKVLYTLLGWKGYSTTETRKVIDVLGFRGGKARFGAAIFTAADSTVRNSRVKAQRVIHGFFFQARMMLQYDPEKRRIVLDHLSPMRADMAGTNALMGPDLSYDAYDWDKGMWRYKRDIDARDLRPSTKPFNPPPRSPSP